MREGVVTEIANLAQQREAAKRELITVEGVTYVSGDLIDIRKPEPEAKALGVHTLAGLIDFLELFLAEQQAPGGSAEHAYAETDVVLHVVGPDRVDLMDSAFHGRFRQREHYAAATVNRPPFNFGAFLEAEAFVIALQAMFVQTPERDQLLAFVGNLRHEAVKVASDNGVTQTATASAGVVLNKEIEVPNPVTLAPFRTFAEVTQPASKFVLRLRGGGEGKLPQVALFEADGAAWRLEAISNVSAFLKAKTKVRVIA